MSEWKSTNRTKKSLAIISTCFNIEESKLEVSIFYKAYEVFIFIKQRVLVDYVQVDNLMVHNV